MILKLDLASDRPLFAQIADGVKQSLLEGTLTVGDALPPGRELSASLDVSLETVQRAYRTLVDEEIVTSRVGRGTRIADPVDLDKLSVDSVVQELVNQARRSGIPKTRLLKLVSDAYAG